MTLVGSLEFYYKVPQVLLDMIHELGIIPVYSLVWPPNKETKH